MYTFVSSERRTVPKMDRVRGPKGSLNTSMRILVIQCMLSDHNRIILDISNRKVSGKFLGVWQLNNTLVKKTLGSKKCSKEKLESAFH